MKKTINNYFFALLILAPFIYSLVICDYLPSTDEAYQLSAAQSLSNSEGYVCFFKPTDNLSLVQKTYLAIWPPGYSLLISIAHYFSISILNSAKLIKLLLLLLSIFSWKSLSKNYIKSKKLNLVFISIIALASIYYSFSPTDLILYSMFPILVIFLLKYLSNISSKLKYLNSEYNLILLISIVIGFLITIRYHSLFLVGAVIVIIVLKNRLTAKKTIKFISLFSIIPFLTFFIILILNKINAHEISEHTSTGIHAISFNFKWIYSIIDNLLINQLFIDKLLLRFPYYNYLIITITLFSLIGFCWVLSAAYKNKKTKKLVVIYLIIVPINILFLFVLTIFFFNAKDQWVPVTEFRYYWFLFPLLLILLFSVFENRFIQFSQYIKRILLSTIYLSILIVSIFFARYKYYKFEAVEKVKNTIETKFENIIKMNMPEKVIIYASNPYFNFLLLDYNYPIYRDFDKLFNSNTYYTRKTLVFLIENKNTGNFVHKTNAVLNSSNNNFHHLSKISSMFSSSEYNYSFNWFIAGQGPSLKSIE